MRGVIRKKITPQYGFIKGEDGREYFVHSSFILNCGSWSLDPGQQVVFDPHEAEKGWTAQNVQIEPPSSPTKIKLKSNPFSPHQPITDPSKFAGRKDSLRNAIDALFNHKSILVTGERGIGKTSTANQLIYVTQGERYLIDSLGIDTGDYRFSYLTVDHRCIPGHTVEDIAAGLIYNINEKLVIHQLAETKTTDTIDLKFYKHQKERIVKTELSSELTNRFVIDIERLWEALIDSGFNGLCLFIDEIDSLDRDIPFAPFMKAVGEKFQADGYMDLSFVVAGNISYVSALLEQHSSALRLFETVRILPMTEAECIDVIHRALSGTNVSISRSATYKIVSMSAGFPAPVHQLGYHSFRLNRGTNIGITDVKKALAHIISEARFDEFTARGYKISPGIESMVVNAIAAMREEPISTMTLSDGIHASPEEVRGALSNLMKKGFVTRVEAKYYKLSDPLFQLFLRWKQGLS